MFQKCDTHAARLSHYDVVDAFAVLGPVHTIIRIFFRKSILCLHEAAFRQHKSSEVPFPETVKARPHESG